MTTRFTRGLVKEIKCAGTRLVGNSWISCFLHKKL
jgi:hypothetical protein